MISHSHLLYDESVERLSITDESLSVDHSAVSFLLFKKKKYIY